MTARSVTVGEAADIIAGNWPEDERAQASADVAARLAAWARDGRGVAIYRNADLGSRGLGAVAAFTFGHPEAQWPDSSPPETMPDGLTNPEGGTVNWRYTLEAVVTLGLEGGYPSNPCPSCGAPMIGAHHHGGA